MSFGRNACWIQLRSTFTVVVVQLLSHVWLFATQWTAACQTSVSFTISRSLLKLMSIESVMLFNHFILCRPLLLLLSIFSSIRVFSNELALHIRWPKYWSFSFSISPSSEYLGLISFRIGWFDLLAVQGILKGLLQHHNFKASGLQHSALLWRRKWQPTPVSFAWKIPWTEKPGRLQSMGSQRVRHDGACICSFLYSPTRTSIYN